MEIDEHQHLVRGGGRGALREDRDRPRLVDGDRRAGAFDDVHVRDAYPSEAQRGTLPQNYAQPPFGQTMAAAKARAASRLPLPGGPRKR